MLYVSRLEIRDGRRLRMITINLPSSMFCFHCASMIPVRPTKMVTNLPYCKANDCKPQAYLWFCAWNFRSFRNKSTPVVKAISSHNFSTMDIYVTVEMPHPGANIVLWRWATTGFIIVNLPHKDTWLSINVGGGLAIFHYKTCSWKGLNLLRPIPPLRSCLVPFPHLEVCYHCAHELALHVALE